MLDYPLCSHFKNKDTDDERFNRKKNRRSNGGGPVRQSRREEQNMRPNGGQKRRPNGWQNRGANRNPNKRPNGGPNRRSRQRPNQGRRKPTSEEIIPSQKRAMENDLESHDDIDDDYSGVSNIRPVLNKRPGRKF